VPHVLDGELAIRCGGQSRPRAPHRFSPGAGPPRDRWSPLGAASKTTSTRSTSPPPPTTSTTGSVSAMASARAPG